MQHYNMAWPFALVETRHALSSCKIMLFDSKNRLPIDKACLVSTEKSFSIKCAV
jgi:hypothetical protein